MCSNRKPASAMITYWQKRDSSLAAALLCLKNTNTRNPTLELIILRTWSTLITIQAIVELADEAIIKTYDPSSHLQRSTIFPVKGCMFFGVPHKGADVARKAFRFLYILALVFNINKNNFKDLNLKSQRFANISSAFRSVQSTHSIPVISFYETVRYNHLLGIVSDISTSGE